jgi:hypothetical protein
MLLDLNGAVCEVVTGVTVGKIATLDFGRLNRSPEPSIQYSLYFLHLVTPSSTVDHVPVPQPHNADFSDPRIDR